LAWRFHRTIGCWTHAEAAISAKIYLHPENTAAVQQALTHRKIEAKKVKGRYGSTARGLAAF
jgi:hypothetical protein